MTSRASRIAPLTLLLLAAAAVPAVADGGERTVTALGRLEPRDGVIRVAGPAQAVVVITELLVEEGDRVEKGQRLAVLDGYLLHEAEIKRLEAELANANRELTRAQKLARGGVSSSANLDGARTAATVAGANLDRAKAELERSVVTAPIDGEVLEIHARNGG
jgi:HlyD family secretion protein